MPNSELQVRMLEKCANQNCSNTFRYLSDGKLYVIDRGWRIANRSRSSQKAPHKKQRRDELRRPRFAGVSHWRSREGASSSGRESRI